MGVAATGDELPLENQQSHDDEPPDDEPKDPPQDGDPNDPPADGADEVEEDVVQIGDEEPPASEETKAAPQWVKDLRAEQKRLRQENAELRAKQGGQPTQQQAPVLPKKPAMADEDIDYDEEKFQAATDGWYAKKREVEAHQAAQQEAVKARQKAILAVHENYATLKKALKVSDFQAAEDEVKAGLSELQQNLILQGAANPALVVLALGKNPAELQTLASIKDPVKFAVALGKLETKVKVTKRTSTKPPPESSVRGSSGSGSSTSATLDRLEAEADKTGDRSKVIAWKRQQKQSGK